MPGDDIGCHHLPATDRSQPACLPLTWPSQGEQHGYSLLRRLEEMGLGKVRGGTLYPLLARHQEHRRVDYRWEVGGSGPARKIFFLTPTGVQDLATLSAGWLHLAGVINEIVPSVEPSRSDR